MKRRKKNRTFHSKDFLRNIFVLRIFFRFISISLPILLVGLGGYYVYSSFVPDSIEVISKHVYSPVVKNEIAHFVKNYLASAKPSSFNSHSFCKNLKDRFGIVEKVSWDWNSFDKAMLCIECVKPSFCVNREFVFGGGQQLFPSSLFLTATLDELPSLKVNPLCIERWQSGGMSHLLTATFVKNNGKILPAGVCTFLQNVPESYLNSYTVSYSYHNGIFLYKAESDKMMLQFVLNEETLREQGKLKIASLVHDDFLSRARLPRWRRARYVTYDLRFKDRIYAKIGRT